MAGDLDTDSVQRDKAGCCGVDECGLRADLGRFRRSQHVILVFGGEGLPAARRMLTLVDREEISRAAVESLEYKEIAAWVGRDASIVSREVNRHGGRDDYRAPAADRAAGMARSRPRPLAVNRDPALRSRVIGLLRAGWSPASTAGRLAREQPVGNPGRVSHEAIHQWVYAQPVATLNRKLVALRTGRARRGPCGRHRRRASANPTASTNAPPTLTTGPCPATGKGIR